MNKKMIIIGVVGAILLVAISVGASVFLSGMLNGGHGKEQAHHEEEAKPKTPPVYKSIEPAFVVNIDDAGMMRFLQVQVDLMSHDQLVVDGVDKYLPRIRGDLLMLFSTVQMETVRSAEGRAQLQQQALATVNKVLKEETGKEGIEALYFTKLVLQ